MLVYVHITVLHNFFFSLSFHAALEPLFGVPVSSHIARGYVRILLKTLIICFTWSVAPCQPLTYTFCFLFPFSYSLTNMSLSFQFRSCHCERSMLACWYIGTRVS